MHSTRRLSIFGSILLFGVLVLSSVFSASALAASQHTTKHPFSPNACPRTVGYGYETHGPDVARLQGDLNASFGLYFDDRPYEYAQPLAVDTWFGPQTYNATWDFQHYNGDPPDGIAGPMTWHSLGEC